MKFKPNFSRLSSTHLWIIANIAMVLLTIIAFVVRFEFGTQNRIEEALLIGQRLEVSLSDGKIYGTVLKTEQAPQVADKDAADPAKTEDSEKKPEMSEETLSSKDKLDKFLHDQNAETAPKKDDFAWIEEDFIGPRMQEEYIALLKENKDNGTELKQEKKVETVSIADLSDKPMIVMIIKGLGLSSSTTERALELPKNVTLGFSPYSPSLESWVKKAKTEGFEVILNLPMETKDFKTDDPGPYALLTSSTKEDNVTRLKMLLTLINDYEAVYSEKSEIFSHTLGSVRPVLEELKKEGKFMVYGGGYSDFSLIQIANSINYPLLVNDMVLDDDVSSITIGEKLAKIEQVAKDKKLVVVMAHPYPITLRMLEIWLPKIREKGINVVPVSFLLGKVIKG